MWEAGSSNRSILLSPPPDAYIKQPEDSAPSSSSSASSGGLPSSAAPPLHPAASSSDSVMDALAAVAGRASWEGLAGRPSSSEAGAAVAFPRTQTSGGDSSSKHVGGGRGYQFTGGRGTNAELAELLGVVDSDDEDSAFDEDGRPRSNSSSAAPQVPSPPMSSSPFSPLNPASSNHKQLLKGDDFFNNILAYDGSVAATAAAEAPASPLSWGDLHLLGDADVDAVPSVATIVSSSFMHDSVPIVASPSAKQQQQPTVGPSLLPPRDTATGGDFAVLLHWGSTSCTQAVYRPLVQLPPHPTSSATAAPPLHLQHGASALVHITVPQLETLPGQHVVVTGSARHLGK